MESTCKRDAENGTSAKTSKRAKSSDCHSTHDGIPKGKLKQTFHESKVPVVLLACGSFNPITNMHLRLFEMGRDFVLHSLPKHQVVGGYLSPVGDAYGKKGLLAADHRLEMARRATSSSWIDVSDWECSQPEYCYTKDVMDYFSSQLNKGRDKSLPRVRVMLLCGADLLESFNTPGVWSDEHMTSILGDYGAVVIDREGSSTHKTIWSNDLLYNSKRGIHIVQQYIPNDISSTSVRRCVNRGLSIRYIVPDAVIEYIEEHSLYLALEK